MRSSGLIVHPAVCSRTTQQMTMSQSQYGAYDRKTYISQGEAAADGAETPASIQCTAKCRD